jgi:signal transduction histidine kinase
VRKFRLELLNLEDEIQLVVVDQGAGFDVEEAKLHQGLGLISMQERVQLLHGSLHLESKSGKGTRNLATVPLRRSNLRDDEVEKDMNSTRMAGSEPR